ncbi:HAD family hydrolase [Janthinobacterium agaricidamnosum]|uniref:HAD-superhydrolase, subIA, variant 3 family protein n=1 Tax=Janthinobacterium agaricidamnosum NBRC 102515 = DSM 9628 TaxID=1349767 RepID=W0V4X2_9BURK|nr:HAD family hydrolase [Janthinobacterium agaricidamnosum]CDG82398.1 HAD-superhydrolase, subIA, variant 3 family protein [Janthinobacterium agaricidamnosum NBRC 102515 = DSM 9628]
MSEHAPSHINHRYRAFLFDMDGTIINSIAAAERIWGQWATRHGLDVAAFLPTIHGARGVDTIAKLNLPNVDPHAEALWITEAEIIDVAGIIEIAGAANFLKSLPASKWAIVTSAPRALAIERLRAAGMPLPQVMVTGEDVSAGKPHPDCYLLAADKLGVDAADCLVFEDATVGILAGQAAGANVMVVTATHAHAIDTPHATIASYDTIVASVDGDGFIVLDRRAG